MRGSDANAALYWLGRMLIGGEDPLFIARRLIAFSSEDVGKTLRLSQMQWIKLSNPLGLNAWVTALVIILIGIY